MVLGTSSMGLRSDLIRAGMNFSISLLSTSLVARSKVVLAAFLTSALVSQTAPARTGIRSGVALPICSGAEVMSCWRTSKQPVLICHLPAVLTCSRIAGRMTAVAQGFMT